MRVAPVGAAGCAVATGVAVVAAGVVWVAEGGASWDPQAEVTEIARIATRSACQRRTLTTEVTHHITPGLQTRDAIGAARTSAASGVCRLYAEATQTELRA